MSKKVGSWQTLGYTVAETNYEYIAAGRLIAPEAVDLVYRYILGRLVQALVSLFVVSIIVFALVRLSGDPIRSWRRRRRRRRTSPPCARTSASTARGPCSTGGS